MMIFTKKSMALSAFLAANLAPHILVEAHGYLKSPRSRNYHASLDPKWWGGTESDPMPENCPQCLNIGGTEARCGIVGDHNYDSPPNAVGGVLDPIIQACYGPGSIIELETILTAHHMGHFEYKACAISPGEVATQECFDANPLTFVVDELYGANPHLEYPERAYIPRADFPGLQYESGGNALFRHKYKLPNDLVGDLILIQWYYITANSCMDEGYDTYDWPEGFHPGVVPVCQSIPPDGRGVPEQFWNCAEVAILATCGGNPTTTVAATSTTQANTTPEATSTTSVNTAATVTTTNGPATTVSSTSTTSATSTSSPPSDLVISTSPRCGVDELDARERCGTTCLTDQDCSGGLKCWGVHQNYCGSIPQRIYEDPEQSLVVMRCGESEIMARTFCGSSCNGPDDCIAPGEDCVAVHSNYCDSAYTEVGVSTTTSPTSTDASTTSATGTTAGTTTTTSFITTVAPPSSCPAHSNACGPGLPCSDGSCCSQWGYCGTTDAYCGECCQSNCDNSPPTPSTPNPTPSPTHPTSNPPTDVPPAVAGEDSRLIAYLGNWQSCPTPEQYDTYTHIVVAFAVSYTWDATKNNCDTQCSVNPIVPICNNQNNQELVDTWRSQGKKVILSFGGAGMGGSWSGDNNNCWDYCFGKEEALSDSLISIVQNQHFDGIDIDYEYCYDVEGSQSGRCSQRDTNLYSDAKAQHFLSSLTSLLRQKLDALGSGYELTHAPMDSDLITTSKYYQVLKEQNENLNFLMPQFYNGVTRPAVDGVLNGNHGRVSAVSMFDDLANDLFPGQPHKVVFGFCISDCSGTGSNTDGDQAITVLSDLKVANDGMYSCNGGAFFWVAEHDINGGFSDAVYSEVSKTAGCSM